MLAKIAGLIGLVCVSPLSAAIYEAEDPTPTAEEVLILEYINRMRADPVAERDILVPEGQRPAGIPGNVDLEMFRKEMGELKPKPPLVFNLDLLKAARWHSYYMIHNGLGHEEEAGKEGFTGVRPSDRTKKAGYPGGAAENAFRDPRDPAYSHLGFVVDWGKGGPGGMQPGRGHRANIMSNYREMGPGAVPHSGKISVTHNFGNRKSVTRFAGGVMYIDRNHNDFYDIGEGVGDVTIIASGGKETIKSWNSGAYTMELPHAKEVKLVASWSGMQFEQVFPAGTDSIKFDWKIPPKAELERADQLIASVEAIPTDSKSRSDQKKRFRAGLDLYIDSQNLHLDPPRQKKIETLTKDIAAELENAKQIVRDALAGDDTKAFKKALKDASKPYKKTAAEAWFEEAELYNNAKYFVDNFEKIQEDKRAGIIENLETAQEKATTKEYTKAFGELIKAARAKSSGY